MSAPYDGGEGGHGHDGPAAGCLRALLLTALIVGAAMLLFGCNSAPLSPSAPEFAQAAAPGPVHVHIAWTSGSGYYLDVPDAIMHAAIDRLERAAQGSLVVHRQSEGSPQIKVRIDDEAMRANGDHGDRGLAWWHGPCAGEIALEFSTTGDHTVLLHELGHIMLAGPHSPYAEDIMAPGGTFRPPSVGGGTGRVDTFSESEARLLRAGLAAGCARIAAWPDRPAQ